MATYMPPKKNTAYLFYVSLVSQANTKIFQTTPTLAAGDVKVAKDDGAPANLATLPVVDGDFVKRVKVALSSDEMNADNITIIFNDAAGDEWCDLTVNLHTVAKQLDDLSDFDETTDQVVVVTNNDKDDYTIAGAKATLDALNDILAAEVTTDMDANSSQLAAIVADTTELQTDWADGGRLDLLIDSLVTAIAGTIPEPTAISDAPATPTLKQALALSYMALRNEAKVTTTKRQYYNDAGTVILEALINDSSSEFTQGELTDPA